MKKTITILICLIMMFSIPVIAQDMDETTEGTETDYVSFDRNRGVLQALTVVDGKTCSDFPDRTIGPKIVTSSSWCLTNSKDFGIAAQVFRVNPRQYLGEHKLSPGERKCWSIPSTGEEYWMDMYWCDIGGCECINERDVKCAGNEVLRERDCTPSGCSWESIWVPKTQSSIDSGICQPDPVDPPVTSCEWTNCVTDCTTLPSKSGCDQFDGVDCVRASLNCGGSAEEPRLHSIYNVITVNGNDVSMNYHIENSGGDMTKNWLIEMQVRPKGLQPLAFVGGQETCSADAPNNVHKDFNLKAGEKAEMELNTRVEDGEYTVYALSVDKCFSEGGNKKVLPYGSGIKIADIVVGDGGGVTPTPDKNILLFILVGAVIGFAGGMILAGGALPVGLIGAVIGFAAGIIVYVIV